MAQRRTGKASGARLRAPALTRTGPARANGLLHLQSLAGNAAVAGAIAARAMVVQREFVDEGQAGEAPLEPAQGEIVQPELGEEAEAAQPVAAETNEFGEMDGAIDTGVQPHTFANKGKVATGKWHHCGGSGGKGNEGVGSATLVAPVYESKPAKKAGGNATATVKKGTGKVTVKRSYNGVPRGDNGTAVWAGSGGGKVFLASSAVSRMNKHEEGHIKETKKFHDTSIKPLETRVKAKKGGATEADAKLALQAHVDWNTAVNAFANSDTAMNTPGGTFDTTDQAKADFYHDKGPKTINKVVYGHNIEAP